MDMDTMEPDFGLHKDFRSSSVPNKRRRKTLTKYYSFRAVHPSWVGQSYYTLQLVSSTVHTARIAPKKPQQETPDFYITHIVEREEPALLETLRRDHPGWYSFHPLALLPEVHIAIAQAKNADPDSYPIVLSEPDFIEPDDLTDPPNIERVPIEPPGAYPPTMPDNLHLKLRLKIWTKTDNYENSTNFWWGPDRRHHRGKRRVREKHLQKWNEKCLGRGMREPQRQLRWEIDSSYTYGVLDVGSWPCRRWDSWVSGVDTTYWDWDDENWLGTGWWDDDGEVADEECGWGDRWTERVDQVEVIYKVSQWRQLWCDYEGMAEMEGSEDEGEEDTFSVGSDVVILERVTNEEVDMDLDMMSDLAEVLVDEEWDVLSYTSSPSECNVLQCE